jgi:OmpA-OmpF porin, OOP family
MRFSRSALVACLLATLLHVRGARAQATGFSVNRFEPAERGSRWFVLESLDLRGSLRPAFGVTGDYQYRPLTVYDRNGDVHASVVRHLLTAHVGASLVLADRVRIGVNVPLVLYDEGQTARVDATTFYAPPASEQGIGDVRAGADLRLFGRADAQITTAVGAQVWLPTGDPASYTGDGRARAMPRFLAAGTVGAFAYAAKVGFLFRDARAASFVANPIGSELVYAASVGVNVLDRRLLVGPEAYGSVEVSDGLDSKTAPLELLLGAHYAFRSGLRVGAGAGTAPVRCYCSPTVRLLASLEWTPALIADADGDGIADDADACPKERGSASADPDKNGCPAPKATVADRDGDGVPDGEDACPNAPGMRTSDPRTNGCGDDDGDGVLDPIDACPTIPGAASTDPKRNGCPVIEKPAPSTTDPDRDKDGITDDKDACPDEAGKPNSEPGKNGCPLAFIQSGEIKTLGRITFSNANAALQMTKETEEVLSAVAQLLKVHPEIKAVHIEGHSDDRGAAWINQKLSDDRAASVMAWLVAHGIDRRRLTATGFGAHRPVDSNATEEGRAKNRRVEFRIR